MIFALDPSDPAGRQLAIDAKVRVWHIQGYLAHKIHPPRATIGPRASWRPAGPPPPLRFPSRVRILMPPARVSSA